MLCYARLPTSLPAPISVSGTCCLSGHLAAMDETQQALVIADPCKAVLEPDHISFTINWPAQTGSLKDICGTEHVRSGQLFSCSRGQVKELCELTLQRSQPLQGLLRLTCSARTCEVYEQRETSTSYASTVRGKPHEGLYQHDIALPGAHRAVLRLLSLQQPGSVKFQSMELLPLPPDVRQHAPAADSNTVRSERDLTESESTRSQKAQVAAMLQTMMASGPPGPSSLANNAQHAQQKLVAALAKAAIGQGQPRKPNGAPWAFGKLLQQQQAPQPQAQQPQAQQQQPQQQQPQQQQPQQQQPQQQESHQQQTQQPHQLVRKQSLIQEVDAEQPASQSSMAGGSSAVTGPSIVQGDKESQPGPQPSHQHSIDGIYARIEALESSSMRMESKVDQILDYCRLLTGVTMPG